jgi:putative ABC transport system permease protein
VLFFEILRVALDAILANKLRSLLTMLGVVIGIAAVIAMVALGEGAQRTVEDQLQTMGANVLTVRAGQAFHGGIGRGQARLTVKDAEALVGTNQVIRAVAPESESRLQVQHGNRNANLSVVGAWPSYFQLHNFILEQGRLYTAGEDRGRRRVVVLGALAGEALGVGPSQALIGETLRIGGVSFEVIGVLREKGSMGWSNPDEALYIPLGTAHSRVLGSDVVRSISVQAVSATSMDAAMAEVDQVLRRHRRIRPGEASDFNVRDQATLLATMQETTRTFSFLLAGIAGISLLVGGIGIMNIMLVSVTERTREIGLRKSLGARRRDILFQFLTEALVLCMVGGALGLAAGIGGSVAMERLAGWNMAVSPQALLLAFGFAAAVGIFFGIWPARRAAALAPIEALRYE